MFDNWADMSLHLPLAVAHRGYRQRTKVDRVKFTSVTSWQSFDVVANAEVDIESRRGWAVHEVGNPSPLPAQVLAGVELGAVFRMGHEVVLRVFGNLGADCGVG